MASDGDELIEGAKFVFKPESIESEEFLKSIENPSEGVNEEIINEVVAEIQPAFEEDGVPPDVLALLQKLWIGKLKKLSKVNLDGMNESFSSDGSFPGFPDSSDELFHGFSDVETPASKPATTSQFDSDNESFHGFPAVEQPLPPRPAVVRSQTGAVLKKPKIQQVDGPNDSSDSEEELKSNDEIDDDDDDDDNDSDDDIDGDDEDPDGEGAEDEPLGSGDDISEGDPSDLFNTENVVVCQYDKITRTRNKWKFHLKDGIMNLNGKDYVFQKATGEAEW